MKRAPLVLGGTAAGLALVFSFHTHTAKAAKLSIGSSPSPSSGATSTTTTPATTSPSTSTGSGPASTAPSTTTSPPTTAASVRTVTGQDIPYRYGDLQLRVTESGTRITNITIVSDGAVDGRSQQINSQALPILQSEAFQAQSTQIDAVSGATFTSEAYVQALQSALQQAGT